MKQHLENAKDQLESLIKEEEDIRQEMTEQQAQLVDNTLQKEEEKQILQLQIDLLDKDMRNMRKSRILEYLCEKIYHEGQCRILGNIR